MTKADLLNECERLGLSTSGTIHSLRMRLQEHLDLKDLDKKSLDDDAPGPIKVGLDEQRKQIQNICLPQTCSP